MRRLWLLLVVSTFGCSMPSGGDVDAGVTSCIGTDAAACSAMSCVSVTGWRSTGQPSVISGAGEYAGCATPSENLPGTTFTCATSPCDGVCWAFRDTRVPDGWATVSCGRDQPLFCPAPQ